MTYQSMTSAIRTTGNATFAAICKKQKNLFFFFFCVCQLIIQYFDLFSFEDCPTILSLFSVIPLFIEPPSFHAHSPILFDTEQGICAAGFNTNPGP